MFGVLALAHASLRRRHWSRFSREPLPGRRSMYIVSSTNGNPSELDVEKNAVRMEAFIGLLAVAVGVAAIIAYA
jgi:hypothetical protein